MAEESHASVKLAVHVAETGHYFELDCPASASVQVVQTCIASAVHVLPQDQLLLCDDARLEPQRTLASYRFPSEVRKVFLFNRVRLLANAPPPSPEYIHIKELEMPSPPSTSVCSHPLDEALDPAVNALPSYEAQFRYHLQKGSAIFNASRDKLELCKQLLREQHVQNLAMDTAKSNMDHFYKILDQIYADFMKHFNQQHKQHAGVLISFNRDLERLRACRLHPCLVSEIRNTLLDCVDEASLQKQVEVCMISHKQFQGKVLQLKVLHTELQQNVQELFNTVPAVDLQSLEQLITKNACAVEEEHIIVQSLSKDMATVKKLVDDCVSTHSSGSLQPHDAVSALGPMYDVHEKNHLPKMEACHRKLGNLLDLFRAKKHDMSVCVHTNMQRVAALQSSIRDMRNQLSVFKEAMARQDEIFSDLKLVRRVGPAYRACLAEVVRRKAAMKLYMGQAGQLAERMARKREVEAARREEFLRVQSAFIPRDLLISMGLFGAPGQCVVNIEPYDTSLLDIDIKDLEKYAPELIFGSHLKGSAANNLPPSDGSRLYSGGWEESAPVKSDLETVEDDISDEIAGTSKLEVENAWLKAEFASTIALLCNIDLDFDPAASSEGGEPQQRGSGSLAATQKTIEALALKDEHAKHLQGMLNASQLQCSSYQKRIRELEQRLSDQYNQLHKQDVTSKSAVSGVTGEAGILNMAATSELMDEGVSSSLDARQTFVTDDNSRSEQIQEGGDESMVDFLVGLTTGDAAMPDSQREGFRSGQMQVNASRSLEKENMRLVNELMGTKEEQLASLQEALLQKENQCAAVEERLAVALGDAGCLREELQKKTAILNECYMNCAELESNLLVAREEARTSQCLADRKAAEYSSLRASSVKLRGLVERLRHCVFTSPTGLAESLEAFADSLNSNDSGEDVTREFGGCVKTLAERVGQLVQKQSKLVELDDINKSGLNAKRETKMELLKNQCERRKMDKQV